MPGCVSLVIEHAPVDFPSALAPRGIPRHNLKCRSICLKTLKSAWVGSTLRATHQRLSLQRCVAPTKYCNNAVCAGNICKSQLKFYPYGTCRLNYFSVSVCPKNLTGLTGLRSAYAFTRLVSRLFPEW